MVVGIDTGVLEALCLTILEQTQAGADLNLGVFPLDLADHVGEAVDVFVAGASAAGHHAHPAGATLEASRRLLEGLIGLQPGVFEDLGIRTECL